MHFKHFITTAFLIAMLPMAAAAQTPAPAQEQPAEKIIRPMTAVDPVTLHADDISITLWGIKPAQTGETPIEVKALELMDSLIAREAVTCKPMGGTGANVIARCNAHSGEDLGIALLTYGYAVVDRRQTLGSPFAAAYAGAEEEAHKTKAGIWRVAEEGQAEDISPEMQMFFDWAPFGGLLLLACIMHYRLRRMEALQQEEMDRAQRKEAALMMRERQVLITMLEGELAENKNRIEAFLMLYGDMLKNLHTGTAQKYQQTGDVVQKHPAVSRAVFDANMSKLSLLDISLAGSLSKLYMTFPKEQEYINIEPTVPVSTVTVLVEKVLKEAEDMLPPLNQAVKALQALATQKVAVT